MALSMKRIKSESILKELDLPTLIDMVFLLLIFFAATISLSTGEKKAAPTPEKPLDYNLPKVTGQVSPTGEDVLSTLLFQIQYASKDSADNLKAVYILWPDDAGLRTDKEAMKMIAEELQGDPPDSSHYAVFPRNFLSMSSQAIQNSRAFRIISDNLRLYQEAHFSAATKSSNTIEIRAVKDTEFKIINYIMQQCSSYDDLIPKIAFRVMAPEPKKGD